MTTALTTETKGKTMEYTLRIKDDAVLPCDSCGSEAPTGEFDWGSEHSFEFPGEKRLLCEFCSTTMASRYTEYPSRDEHGSLRAEIWKAAACVFNMLKTPPEKRST